jgi:hypothetical protein
MSPTEPPGYKPPPGSYVTPETKAWIDRGCPVTTHDASDGRPPPPWSQPPAGYYWKMAPTGEFLSQHKLTAWDKCSNLERAAIIAAGAAALVSGLVLLR